MKRILFLTIAILLLSAIVTNLKASHRNDDLVKANTEALIDSSWEIFDCFSTITPAGPYEPLTIVVRYCSSCQYIDVIECSNPKQCIVFYP